MLNVFERLFCDLTLKDFSATGEFGWVNAPGEKARVTFYSADKRGYRAKSIMLDIKAENKDKEKGKLEFYETK